LNFYETDNTTSIIGASQHAETASTAIAGHTGHSGHSGHPGHTVSIYRSRPVEEEHSLLFFIPALFSSVCGQGIFFAD